MSKKFRRYNSYKLKRLANPWRKPRGLHNKLRLGFSGYGKAVKVGHGTPSKELNIVVVKNQNDLDMAKEKNAQIIFSSKLGLRKKVEMMKKVQELKLTVINVKDDFISKVEEKLKQRKTVKEELKKKKESKQKELDKKAKTKKDEKSDEEKSDDEKKETEKKEKDKLLTKKDGGM